MTTHTRLLRDTCADLEQRLRQVAMYGDTLTQRDLDRLQRVQRELERTITWVAEALAPAPLRRSFRELSDATEGRVPTGLLAHTMVPHPGDPEARVLRDVEVEREAQRAFLLWIEQVRS